MLIRGIDMDMNMAIVRSPDLVRDVSVSQKRPEVAQDFLSVVEKARDAQAQARVLRTQRVEMDIIHTDTYSGSGSNYARGGEGSDFKGKERNASHYAFSATPSNSKIDIIV